MVSENTRNRNIDIIRAVALCVVMIYHIWVLTGQVVINNNILKIFIVLGGETGVTAFFLISGIGIYFALKKMEESHTLKFSMFLKRRMLRIIPEYYLSILFTLFLSNRAVYLSKQGMVDILLHLIFMHNALPSTGGSINGVLWTMAITMQFYIVAIPIYRLCEKFSLFFSIIAISITIVSKYILFHYIQPVCEVNGGELSFWFSRQLFLSVIDNFVLGMFTAKLIYERKNKYSIPQYLYVLGVIVSFLLLYYVSRLGYQQGIHTDNISGYTWHSMVAICISFGIYCFAAIKLNYKDFISKFFLWLSKYEYGIYIVHLMLIQVLIDYSPIIQYCNSKFVWGSYVILFIAAIIIGCIFSLLVDAFRKVYILKR